MFSKTLLAIVTVASLAGVGSAYADPHHDKSIPPVVAETTSNPAGANFVALSSDQTYPSVYVQEAHPSAERLANSNSAN